MIFYNTHLKDIIGNNYIGINIPNDFVHPYLKELKDILGDSNFEIFTKNQQNRDHGNYHITVINVMDYNKLHKADMKGFVNSLDKIFKYEIDDLKFLGIGTAQRNENKSYFIVCNSEKLNAIRNRYELPPHDFHITLGFNFKDVFGVRKNEIMKKNNNFLKLLSNEYYKSENWNFVKKISNFDSDKNSEIIPVMIKDSYVKVKCDGDFMDIVYMDNQFWIATKYAADKDLPKLSENEIAKLLKNK